MALVGEVIEVELVGKDPEGPNVVLVGVAEVDPFGAEVVGSPHEGDPLPFPLLLLDGLVTLLP